MSELDRRDLLRTGAATGLLLVGAGLTTGTAEATPAHHPGLPPVPGMRGDRRANELWYIYERDFFYAPAAEVVAAYQAIAKAYGGSSVEGVYQIYRLARQNNVYPDAFLKRVEPAHDAYALLSRLQLAIYDEWYRGDLDLIPAFLRLGDGSLYDPRMPVGFKVHMMNIGPNGEPPMAWHIWHAINRAMTLMDIDTHRWQRIDRLVGMGWVAQSLAMPVTDAVNQRLSVRDSLRIVRQWWSMSPDEVDVAFDSFPYPAEQS